MPRRPALPARPRAAGATYLAKPKITKVKCVRRCASRRRARGGSTVRITGTDLAAVRLVTFHGTYGRGDDATARARGGNPGRLSVRVPVGAISGPVSVTTADAVRPRRTRSISILPAPPPRPTPR